MIIHKTPWVFAGIWKVLHPLLDPVVMNKVVFTHTDKQLLTCDLLQWVPDTPIRIILLLREKSPCWKVSK